VAEFRFLVVTKYADVVKIDENMTNGCLIYVYIIYIYIYIIFFPNGLFYGTVRIVEYIASSSWRVVG